MSTHSQFQEYYAGLHEDELVHIALTRELMPQAQEALHHELAQRGITDLARYRGQMVQERATEEQSRHDQLERRSTTLTWTTRFGYVVGTLVFLYGVFCVVVPQPEGEDSTIMIALGPVIVLGAWVRAKLSRLWGEKVLFRQPPQ